MCIYSCNLRANFKYVGSMRLAEIYPFKDAESSAFTDNFTEVVANFLAHNLKLSYRINKKTKKDIPTIQSDCPFSFNK